jgi:hypothetical protein
MSPPREQMIETWGYDPADDVGRARKALVEYQWLFAGALIVVAFFVINEQFADLGFVDEYGANLATDGIAVLVTIGVVERILRAQRERELGGLRARALKRLQRATVPVVVLFAEMACESSGRSELLPMNATAVIDEWERTVGDLNLAAAAPTQGIAVSAAGEEPQGETWFHRVTRELERFEARVEGTIDLYAEAVGIEAMAVAEDVLACALLHMVKTDSTASLARLPPRPGSSLRITWTDGEGGTALEGTEFAARMRALVEAIEAKSRRPLLTVQALHRAL